jgi:hypothetical protein
MFSRAVVAAATVLMFALSAPLPPPACAAEMGALLTLGIDMNCPYGLAG